MRAFIFGISLSILLITSLVHIFSQFEWMGTVEASPLSTYEEAVVQQGDSLWKLADQYNETVGVDVREMIQRIVEENGLEDPYIYPGQVIRIPMDS